MLQTKTALKNFLAIFFLLVTCFQTGWGQSPKREFRAVWISTVANLDWPSQSGLSSSSQKKEFLDLLDLLKDAGFNAVFVQVRPSADAFYPSDIAHWSHYLTGTQGKSPLYDPLEFMVSECHKRNMEFHAWFNPVRAVSHVRFSPVAFDHISRNRPEWFFQYGEVKYFNPGIPAVREYIAEVVLEVVRNYDVDGVHFDDYFYPYPLAGQPIPDWKTFKEFGEGFNTVAEWRRNNIDRLIEMVGTSVKRVKPWMKFGISPFGVWRNKDQDESGSDTYRACSSYDDLFADCRKWYTEGWIDYIAPQIYWSTRNYRANFRELLDWWAGVNSDRHLYVGHGLSRMNETPRPRNLNSAEFVLQVGLCRQNEKACGSIFFRAGNIQENTDGITGLLRDRMFNTPALVPAMKWLDSIPPDRPQNLVSIYQDQEVFLKWDPPMAVEPGDSAAYYVVYRFQEDEEIMNLDSGDHILACTRELSYTDKSVEEGKSYIYCLTAVDRLHNESFRFIHKKIDCKTAP